MVGKVQSKGLLRAVVVFKMSPYHKRLRQTSNMNRQARETRYEGGRGKRKWEDRGGMRQELGGRREDGGRRREEEAGTSREK
jgi:hypothetical protein